MTNLKVIMVEDSEEDAQLILLELRKGGWDFEVQRVETALELSAALLDQTFDIAFCDYWMQGFDGLSALSLIRAKGITIPVILISGTIGEELAVQAMKAGANDYLMKDNLQRLVPAVQRELREYQSRQAQEKALIESEEKFRQAQKMEIVGRLAGSIAHDFNNILAIILGYLDLLHEKRQGNTFGIVELNAIEKSAQQATALVRQLLSISRKHTAAPYVMDLNAVITENEPILRMLMGENITWNFQAPIDLPKIYADPHRVAQVLLNLVSNARDAMRKSGNLTVRTYPSQIAVADLNPGELAQPGRYVTLEIRDTGCGMDSVTLRNIFEPFYTTKEVGEGTGLGLSTVRSIVDEAMGLIRVESQMGAGTLFQIHFPRALDNDSTVIQEKGSAKIPGKGQLILVLEDNTELRQLIVQILERNGYQSAQARDFEEAKDKLSHDPNFDLLLCDLSVPGITRSEAVYTLPLLRPNMKILIMSGYAPDAAVRQGLELKLFQYIGKPFTPSQLLQTLHLCLNPNEPIAKNRAPA